MAIGEATGDIAPNCRLGLTGKITSDALRGTYSLHAADPDLTYSLHAADRVSSGFSVSSTHLQNGSSTAGKSHHLECVSKLAEVRRRDPDKISRLGQLINVAISRLGQPLNVSYSRSRPYLC